MEGAGQVKRRKLDKVRRCYSQASIWLMVLLCAFTLYRIVS
jgi:hypothetical protein